MLGVEVLAPRIFYADLHTRIQALALAEHGIAHKIVAAFTKISCQTVSQLQKQACDRCYDPTQFKKLSLSYVTDKPRVGRPTVITPKVESAILAAVQKNRYSREKTSAMLASESFGIILIEVFLSLE